MTPRRGDQGVDRRFVEDGAGDRLDERIGACLRHVIDQPGLPQARLEALGRRLATPRRSVSRRHLSYLAFAAIVLLGAGTAAALVRVTHGRLFRVGLSDPALTAGETPRTERVPAANPEPPLEQGAPAPPAVDERASGPSISAPAGASRKTTRALPRPSIASTSSLGAQSPAATAEAPSSLGTEARLLRRAIESLRSQANPRLTLGLLEEYRQSFPDGHLRANADLIRIDALLAMNRRAEALALLQPLALEEGPRAEELLVTRGELRASSDCSSAVHDFSRALARPLSNALAERALRGRIVCRVRMDDRTAAEADLRSYVQRFPDAAFAPRARALLERDREGQ